MVVNEEKVDVIPIVKPGIEPLGVSSKRRETRCSEGCPMGRQDLGFGNVSAYAVLRRVMHAQIYFCFCLPRMGSNHAPDTYSIQDMPMTAHDLLWRRWHSAGVCVSASMGSCARATARG